MQVKTYFKDDVSGDIFSTSPEGAEDFAENYENPANLIHLEPTFCDGGGFNGKSSKIAFGKDLMFIRVLEIEEERTNNEMEYLALITALTFGDEEELFLTDSKLVVNQINNNWKCNFKHLERLRDIAKILLEKKKGVIMWCPREENLAGIKLDQLKKVRVK